MISSWFFLTVQLILLFSLLQISLCNQILLVMGTLDLLSCCKTLNFNDSYRHLLLIQLYLIFSDQVKSRKYWKQRNYLCYSWLYRIIAWSSKWQMLLIKSSNVNQGWPLFLSEHWRKCCYFQFPYSQVSLHCISLSHLWENSHEEPFLISPFARPCGWKHPCPCPY